MLLLVSSSEAGKPGSSEEANAILNGSRAEVVIGQFQNCTSAIMEQLLDTLKNLQGQVISEDLLRQLQSAMASAPKPSSSYSDDRPLVIDGETEMVDRRHALLVSGMAAWVSGRVYGCLGLRQQCNNCHNHR